mgnify:CR=1 FL=1
MGLNKKELEKMQNKGWMGFAVLIFVLIFYKGVYAYIDMLGNPTQLLIIGGSGILICYLYIDSKRKGGKSK